MSFSVVAEVLKKYGHKLLGIAGVFGYGEGTENGKPVIEVYVADYAAQRRLPGAIEGIKIVSRITGIIDAYKRPGFIPGSLALHYEQGFNEEVLKKHDVKVDEHLPSLKIFMLACRMEEEDNVALALSKEAGVTQVRMNYKKKMPPV